MRTQSEDTSPEAERVQIEIMRKMSVAEKFALMCSLSQQAIEASRDAIRASHPEASEEEVRLLFVEFHYGKELADKVRADLARRQQERALEDAGLQ